MSRSKKILRWTGRLLGGLAALVLLAACTVYALSERRVRKTFTLPDHPLAVRTDSATVARGEHLATVRACVGCHGPGLVGHVELDEPMIGRLAGPNLTRGGRGAQLTDADWERAVRHGVKHDGTPLLIMPAHEHNRMPDEDLGAIVAYARSLPAVTAAPPKSRMGPVIRTMFAAGQVNVLAAEQIDHAKPHDARFDAEPTARYGAYVATMCIGCHGPGLSGGKIPGAPPDWKPAANLTRGGIGSWTEADLSRALRTGRRPDGSMVDTTRMAVALTKHMTDTEVAALYAYLREIPAKEYGNR